MALRMLFRFSLATVFVAGTVLAVWLGYEVNWVHQRREFIRFPRAVTVHFVSWENHYAPGFLQFFGERGIGSITFKIDGGEPISAAIEQNMLRAKALFPEAIVEVSSKSDFDGYQF